jgi:hypothetical protein
MTPKETAEQLIRKYYTFGMNKEGQSLSWLESKQCALLAVQFARQQFDYYCAAEYGTDGSPDDHFDTIKKEINNL